PGRPPPPLTGQDHVHAPALVPPHADRLELPPDSQRLGQSRELLLVEFLPGLVRVAVDLRDRDQGHVPTPLDPTPAVRGAAGGCPGRLVHAGGPGTVLDVLTGRAPQFVQLAHVRRPPLDPRRFGPPGVRGPRRRAP